MVHKACSYILLVFGAMLFCRQVIRAQKKEDKMNITDNALLIEQTEMAAWQDLIDAAPESFRLEKGLQHKAIGGGMAINFQKEPIPLFNRVIGLGLKEPLTQGIIDEVKAFYARKEKYLIHYFPLMKPSDADSTLIRNGFYVAGSWERVVRDNRPLNNIDTGDIDVKLVDESLKEEWLKFLIDTYGFDFYEWPRAFGLRKGWKHYVALRDGKIIACRGFFMTPQKTIFSGVEAPVPGVMTTDCNPDFAIWRRAIQDGLNEGAILFVADIEKPDKEKNKAAYDGFRHLGFHIPYTRYHYRLNR